LGTGGVRVLKDERKNDVQNLPGEVEWKDSTDDVDWDDDDEWGENDDDWDDEADDWDDEDDDWDADDDEWDNTDDEDSWDEND